MFIEHLDHDLARGPFQSVLCADCSVILYYGGKPKTRSQKRAILMWLDDRAQDKPPRDLKRVLRKR